MTRSPIQTLEELASTAESLRKQGKKIAHCHGVFDLLHIGHIRHFQEARTFGDVLIVTITPDVFVNKGFNRPAFPQALRAEAIAALKHVDYVAINNWPTAVETIKLLRPHFYVKGPDYKNKEADLTGEIYKEEATVNSVGGRLAFTDDLTFSSSNIINKNMPPFSEKMQRYLEDFKKKFSSKQVAETLQSLKNTKVLIIGESIIDQYSYCKALGKSGKEPMLALHYQKEETFPGGALAIANHLTQFSDHVSLLSFTGKADPYGAFIEERLDKQVERHLLPLEEGNTVVKRRFVEAHPFQKLFELYVMTNDEGHDADSKKLLAKLKELLPHYDTVIVADYGHGMLSKEAIALLCTESKFLAVNAQINAGNQGFNTIFKYAKAGFICLSENEIRLNVRSKKRDLREIVKEVAEALHAERFIVTRGQEGSLCYSKEEGFLEVPAFTGPIVDRVGAGDAIFSIAALCAKQKIPLPLVGLIASATGMQAVATLCNESAINQNALFRFIEYSLK